MRMIPIAPPTQSERTPVEPLHSSPESLLVMLGFILGTPIALWAIEQPVLAAQIGLVLLAVIQLGRLALAYARSLAEAETTFSVPGTGVAVELRTAHRS